MKITAAHPVVGRGCRASLLAGIAVTFLLASAALAQPGSPDSASIAATPDSGSVAAPAPDPRSAGLDSTAGPRPPVWVAVPMPSDTAGAGASGTAIAPTVIRQSRSPNPPAAAVRKVRLDRSSRNVVRTGPGHHFAIVGVHPKGATFPVIAKSGEWNNVRLSDSQSGWVHASLCTEFDDLSDLEFRPNPRLYSRTGSYTLGGYGGAYAFDRKSNSLVLGGRLGYYVLDRLQAEAGVAWTHVQRPPEIVESLFGLTLEAEDFHMLFYHLNLVYEVLPGRQMVPFVTVGVGSSIMQGETEPSLNFGAGTELFLSKRMAMRWEFRTYRFDSGSPGARLSNHNVEFTLGTTYLF
jgi:outer membrane beta-barrel protein